MRSRVLLRKWLSEPPLRGWPTLLAVTAALAAPTVLGLALQTRLPEFDFTPYAPFVLLSGLLLEWRAAWIVTLGSAVLGDWLFVEPRGALFGDPSEAMTIVFFGLAAILAVALVRATLKDRPGLDPARPAQGSVIFSLRDGLVCVSWSGGPAFVPLGPGDDVAKQMRDFLAQQEVGKRLTNRSATAALRDSGAYAPDAKVVQQHSF